MVLSPMNRTKREEKRALYHATEVFTIHMGYVTSRNGITSSLDLLLRMKLSSRSAHFRSTE